MQYTPGQMCLWHSDNGDNRCVLKVEKTLRKVMTVLQDLFCNDIMRLQREKQCFDT